jgi:hypothetical protein
MTAKASTGAVARLQGLRSVGSIYRWNGLGGVLKNCLVHISPERLARKLSRVERILFPNIQTQLAATIEKTLVKALETKPAFIDSFALLES